MYTRVVICVALEMWYGGWNGWEWVGEVKTKQKQMK